MEVLYFAYQLKDSLTPTHLPPCPLTTHLPTPTHSTHTHAPTAPPPLGLTWSPLVSLGPDLVSLGLTCLPCGLTWSQLVSIRFDWPHLVPLRSRLVLTWLSTWLFHRMVIIKTTTLFVQDKHITKHTCTDKHTNTNK